VRVHAPPGIYTDAELRWARERPPAERTPIPAAGDEVLYRHDQNGPVERAEVEAVQPLDDLYDPNLWTLHADAGGSPLLLEGRPVMREVNDPWPLLTLRTLWGRVQTREARLPGSPGWLPDAVRVPAVVGSVDVLPQAAADLGGGYHRGVAQL
jgi:hypothetical protein